MAPRPGGRGPLGSRRGREGLRERAERTCTEKVYASRFRLAVANDFLFFCSHLLVGRLVFVSTNDLLHSYHLFFFLLLVCSFISSAFSCILWILERVEELRTRVASSHRLEWSSVTQSWARLFRSIFLASYSYRSIRVRVQRIRG